MPNGVFSRDTTGRLAFEVFRLPAQEYESLCAKIVGAFELFPNTPRIEEIDVVFQDFSRDDELVGLEWDNWSGFRVVALKPTSEQLVQQIAAYLCAGV